ELRRAHDEGLIDPQFLRRTELDELERRPRGEDLDRMRQERPPIEDVVADTAWWDRRMRDDDVADDDVEDDDLVEDELVQEPYRAPPRIGRNEPCPCGSGRKYKKCHGG